MKRAEGLGEQYSIARLGMTSAALGAAMLSTCIALGRTSPIDDDPATLERVASLELRDHNEPYTCVDENTIRFEASGHTYTVASDRCDQNR